MWLDGCISCGLSFRVSIVLQSLCSLAFAMFGVLKTEHHSAFFLLFERLHISVLAKRTKLFHNNHNPLQQPISVAEAGFTCGFSLVEAIPSM